MQIENSRRSQINNTLGLDRLESVSVLMRQGATDKFVVIVKQKLLRNVEREVMRFPFLGVGRLLDNISSFVLLCRP